MVITTSKLIYQFFPVCHVRQPRHPPKNTPGSPAEAKTFLRNELNSAAGAVTGLRKTGTTEGDEVMAGYLLCI